MTSTDDVARTGEAPIDLKLVHWSGILDMVRGTTEIMLDESDFVERYDRMEINNLYHHISNEIQPQVEVGQDWNKIVTVHISQGQLMCLLTVIANADDYMDEFSELPDIRPEPSGVCQDMTAQFEARFQN